MDANPFGYEVSPMETRDKKVFNPLPVPARLLDAARDLRKHMTDAEQLLWFCLRRKQLAGFRFRRQHPIQRFILDFYCSEAKLVVELDGGQHNEDIAMSSDALRTAFLERHGIRVVRVWNNEVFQNLEGVLQMIYEVLQERVEGGHESLPPP